MSDERLNLLTFKSMSEQIIGVDLGGTAIKLGRFTLKGECLQSWTLPTPQPPRPESVIAILSKAIAQLDPEGRAIGIGIGTPGPSDAAGRVARYALNLEGWTDVPLADRLEALTGKLTVVSNDANCAALGEAWLGAGRPFQDMILLTLGTGVGGAVILNRQLFVGRSGAAGELGLVSVDLNGHPCNSGNRGSLEQHVSAQAIRRRMGQEPKDLAEKARNGNAMAIAFWQNYGRELAAGIASSVYVLTPEAVIIGGGISASADLFFPALEAELEQRVALTSREGMQVLVAELGNQAGMIGAAHLAGQRLCDKGFCV
jgi:glucokinase